MYTKNSSIQGTKIVASGFLTRQSSDFSGFLPVKGETVTFQTWLDMSMGPGTSWDQGARLV